MNMELVASIRRAFIVGGTSLDKNDTSSSHFTPWPHQIDAVYKIITDLLSTSSSRSYMIQHSTGSGKSLTLACLTSQLLALDDRYDMIIILVDRIHLDDQLGTTVHDFLFRLGIRSFHQVKKTTQVVDIMSQERVVMLTTIQKLQALMDNPVLWTKALHAMRSNKKGGEIAVIADEAHRSHNNETRSNVERMLRMLASEKPVTFVGFSATPEIQALELFSEKENVSAFHQYMMKEAIGNGHIHNVLLTYQCIHLYLETSIPSKVQRALKASGQWLEIWEMAGSMERVLIYKADLMLQDYTSRKKSFSDAKCLIVVRSRGLVVQYHRILTALVKTRSLAFKLFCTFSTTVDDPTSDTSVSEKQVNARNVTLQNADMIIVCDKLDTGYNEPKLVALYLDRPVTGARAVQLLSRLNRPARGKLSTQVIDFVNHPLHISDSFASYWSIELSTIKSRSNREAQQFLTNAKIIVEYMKYIKNDKVHQLKSVHRDIQKQLAKAIDRYEEGSKKYPTLDCITPDVLSVMKAIVCTTSGSTTSTLVCTVKRKMQTRVTRHVVSFEGSINPDEHHDENTSPDSSHIILPTDL